MIESDQLEGIVVAGATASGKSSLALRLAKKYRGAVINADSMQVYQDLQIITARPTAEDVACVPHHLYGHVDGATLYSAAKWAEEAVAKIQEVRNAGFMPILVGGTGLYFRALFSGLAALPPIPEKLREKLRKRALKITSEKLHAELKKKDPEMAARLHPSDRQRILRALEVMEATGRSLAEFHAETTPLLDAAKYKKIVLKIDRDILERRIHARFDVMVKQGAVEEVVQLLDKQLSPELPVMKAIGVRELGAHVQDHIPLEEAQQNAVLSTKHYAKRQDTWFKNQMKDWCFMEPKETSSL